MNLLEINQKLQSLEEKIGVAEHRRDIARAKGMNNLGDAIGTEINTNLNEWQRLFSILSNH